MLSTTLSYSVVATIGLKTSHATFSISKHQCFIAFLFDATIVDSSASPKTDSSNWINTLCPLSYAAYGRGNRDGGTRTHILVLMREYSFWMLKAICLTCNQLKHLKAPVLFPFSCLPRRALSRGGGIQFHTKMKCQQIKNKHGHSSFGWRMKQFSTSAYLRWVVNLKAPSYVMHATRAKIQIRIRVRVSIINRWNFWPP